MNEVMVSQFYELSDDMRDMGELDFREEYLYDPRLKIAIPKAHIMQNNIPQLYANYLSTFCELVNRHGDSRPGMLTACGFLPVGVEPVALSGEINGQVIIPALEKHNIPYYFQKQMSPVSSKFERINEANGHDIWVSKLDAATVVNKPPHNIRVIDLLEAIL